MPDDTVNPKKSRPPVRRTANGSSPTLNPSGFTLIELLVVIAIIALLMAIMMPSLQRVKKQARAVACQSNLKQWGLIFSMYTDYNDGLFLAGNHHDNHVAQWHRALKEHYQEKMINFCPSAIRNRVEKAGGTAGNATWNHLAGGTFYAWGQNNGDSFTGGSYAVNSWASNPPDDKASGPPENFWRTPNVPGGARIPLFMDSTWIDGWPGEHDAPPQFFDDMGSSMSRYCIDRHQGGTNCIFLDWSVRKIGCKEIWTFRWHRNFKTDNEWTPAGGVAHEDWPPWMEHLKDY